ncbi:MAG: class I SAM-dependent methyltransferase [Nitrosarchaeum sp.]
MSLASYAKIGIHAIKNHKVSEYVDLKLQKENDKKKSKRKVEYFENEITAEIAIEKIFPNQTFNDNIFLELENHIDNFVRLKKSGDRHSSVDNPYPIDFGLGKNICRMLYYLVKFSDPDIVVETGVANGFSSSYMLLALDALKKGKLISIDYLVMPWHTKEKVGQAIPESLKIWHELIIGNSLIEIPKLKTTVKQFDIFLHDSSHTYKHMMEEYQIAWPHLKNGGYLMSDDVSQNDAFLEFADRVRRKPLIVKKDNQDHFGIIKK